MSGFALKKSNGDVSPIVRAHSVASRLWLYGQLVSMTTRRKLRGGSFIVFTPSKADLCLELAEVIRPFTESDARFASLRLVARFGTLDGVLSAGEKDLIAIVPDEPRLVRALTRSRYFAALRVA